MWSFAAVWAAAIMTSVGIALGLICRDFELLRKHDEGIQDDVDALRNTTETVQNDVYELRKRLELLYNETEAMHRVLTEKEH